MSVEGVPSVDNVAAVIRGEPPNKRAIAEAVHALYAPVFERLEDAVYLLQSAAQISIPELNPDGVDQAAHSMRLALVGALEVLGAPIPQQRVSMKETQ